MNTKRTAILVILILACASIAMAQVKTQTTVQPGAVAKEVKVERGEVVYVAGNEVVIKMDTGEIRHITVPDGAKGTVEGREVGIADLRPGMKLEKTITTTTTQKTVKTVKTGTGTVINVMAPLTVTLRFEDNSVQTFKVPKDTKFTVDGQKMTVFDLKKGMKVSATRITEEPAVETTSANQVTGTMPPPPPTPPMEGVLLIAEPKPVSVPAPATMAQPAAAPAAAPEPAVTKLPKTGTFMPLVGLLGLLFSGASIGLRMLRRS